MAWSVNRVESVNTSSDRDTTEAALVYLERDEETARVTVELSGTAGEAAFDAQAAIRPYLDEDEVPKHLIVGSDGLARPAE
jgi:hypothetical protein